MTKCVNEATFDHLHTLPDAKIFLRKDEGDCGNDGKNHRGKFKTVWIILKKTQKFLLILQENSDNFTDH